MVLDNQLEKKNAKTTNCGETNRKGIEVRTLLLDVSGVIGDVRGTCSWKIKVAMEEADLDHKYGIGFSELMRAYSTGGWDSLWERYLVKDTDRNEYMKTWSAIQEYPPGSVRVYSEVPFVFNALIDRNINICLVTRLTNDNVENVLHELKRRGFKYEKKLKVFNPQSEDERRKDRIFVENILYKACIDTLSPKAYIGDELDRGPQLRIFDEDLIIIGSARGFYSVDELKTAYYKMLGNRFDFKNFDEHSRASREGYQKIFDYVITSLKDLLYLVEGE